MHIQYYRHNLFKYYTYIHTFKYIYVHVSLSIISGYTVCATCKIDFASAIHPERKIPFRRGPVPTKKKRQFKRGCDTCIPKRIITKPDSELALKNYGI